MNADQHEFPNRLLELHQDVVHSDWIDYNGHMNDGYYAVAFGFATDAFMDHIGLDAAYRTRTKHTIYTAEMHVTYLREAKAADRIRFTTQLLAFDAKRCHIFHRMLADAENYLAATCELMLLHVDQTIGKVVPFALAINQQLAQIYTAHQSLPMPVEVGHVISMRRS